MELRHLQSFLALSDELHFGRAADRVGIAQPALSRHIQQLETEIGSPLFERTPRAVRLTRAGEELRLRVKVHVDGIANAVTACKAAGAGHVGRLRVGFVSNLSYRLLPKVLETLRQAAPDAAFDLHELSTDPQVDAIRAGELDVGLLVLPVSDPGLIMRRLFQDPLVVVMPEHHELAAHESLTLAQIREFPFVMCPRYRRTGFQHVILERCSELGFVPQVKQEVEGKTLMWELIAAGIGISIVPASSSAGHRPGLAYRPINDRLRPIDVAALWTAGNDEPLRRLFVDTAVAAAAEIYGPIETRRAEAVA